MRVIFRLRGVSSDAAPFFGRSSGVAPLAWTPRPTEAALGRPLSELVKYAQGEFTRIPAYAAEGKAFCVLPADWESVGQAHKQAVYEGESTS